MAAATASGRLHRVAGGRGLAEPGHRAFFADQAQREHRRRAGEHDGAAGEEEPRAQDLGIEEGGKVHGGSQREGEERDGQAFPRCGELPHRRIDLRQDKAQAHRQQHRQEGGGGKLFTQQAEAQQGEEGAVVERDHRDRPHVGAVAVLAGEGDVESAVAVLHRGDDRHHREAEEAVVGI
jgi:hypothetical protein